MISSSFDSLELPSLVLLANFKNANFFPAFGFCFFEDFATLDDWTLISIFFPGESVMIADLTLLRFVLPTFGMLKDKTTSYDFLPYLIRTHEPWLKGEHFRWLKGA